MNNCINCKHCKLIGKMAHGMLFTKTYQCKNIKSEHHKETTTFTKSNLTGEVMDARNERGCKEFVDLKKGIIIK